MKVSAQARIPLRVRISKMREDMAIDKTTPHLYDHTSREAMTP